jgi:hypothetical protein
MQPEGRGFAILHAIVYRSDGQVFEDAQQSGYQDVPFDFEGMSIEGEIGELQTYASDGELWVDGKNGNGVFCCLLCIRGK